MISLILTITKFIYKIRNNKYLGINFLNNNIYYLLFIIYYLLFIIYYLLFIIIYYILFI